MKDTSDRYSFISNTKYIIIIIALFSFKLNAEITDLQQYAIRDTILADSIIMAIQLSSYEDILNCNELFVLDKLILSKAKQDTIKGGISFIDSHFLESVDGSGIKFSNEVSFNGSHFYKEVNFDNSHFLNQAHFDNCVFKDKFDFTDAKFLFEFQFCEPVSFKEAVFNGETYFNEARFNGNVTFYRADFIKHTEFVKTIFSEELDLDYTVFYNFVDFTEVKFPKVSFKDTEFQGEVIIENSDLSRVSGLEKLPNNDALIYNNKTVFPKSYSPPSKFPESYSPPSKWYTTTIGIIASIITIIMFIYGLIKGRSILINIYTGGKIILKMWILYLDKIIRSIIYRDNND